MPLPRHSASQNKVRGSQYGAQPSPQDPPTPPVSRQGTGLEGPVASNPRLPTQSRDSSPSTVFEDVESDKDTRAYRFYDRRDTVLDEEERAESRQAQARSVYPKNTKRVHRANIISQPERQPPSSASGIDLIQALSAAGVSGDQIGRITENGIPGNKYGKLKMRGRGIVIQGNTVNHDTMIPFLPNHKFGRLSTSNTFEGKIYQGIFHTSVAQGFMNKDLPAPPTRVAEAREDSDSESEEDSD